MKRKKQRVVQLSFTLILIFLLTACAQTPQPIPTNTTQPSPTFPPTHTPQPTASLVPTFTHTPPPKVSYLYTWPAPPLTETQIQEVIDCENRTWGMVENFTPANYQIENPSNACEYSMQAISTIEDLNFTKMSEAGGVSALQALADNPGIVLSTPAFFNAFHTMGIVAPPPFVHSKLESAKFVYSWTGDGIPTSFQLEITTDGPVTATGTVEKVVASSADDTTDSVIISRKINKEIKSRDFANLGKALDNLIPIHQQTNLSLCENHHPDWTITLKYAGGHTIILKTNQSTYMVGLGGPFQTEIDGQAYLLASPTFHTSLYEIIRQLAIELGSPVEAACSNIRIAETLLGEKP